MTTPSRPHLQRDRLRPIKDRDQRDAAEGGEMIDQRAHERLDALVGHQRDLDPARVLQARGEEVHLRLGAVLIA